MTVGRRLMVNLSILVACCALIGAVAMIGLGALSRSYAATTEEYRELRTLYEIGHEAAIVRTLLNATPTDHAAIERHAAVAAQEAESLVGSPGRPGGVTQAAAIGRVKAVVTERLAEVTRGLRAEGGASESVAGINASLSEIAGAVAATQAQIVETRERAEHGLRTALALVASVLAVAILVAAAVGVTQYRSVMRPLRALDKVLADMTDERLGPTVEEQGDREFRRLMSRFNRMSATIASLHSTMRQQVETKSRQLVRSEQLAGVGQLAAGLAHEINNPLGIIAGYAQASLRKIERAEDDAARHRATESAARTLRIVCEEAFRCRDITRDLLRLARPAEGPRERVCLDEVARRAIELVRHLPVAQGRELMYRCNDESADAVCAGQSAHLLQVLINLLTNGLEACGPQGGRVVLQLEAEHGQLLLSVSDNGCGMEPEVLARAFDPFFTDKPRRGLSGNGLGLSISHAIIESHGGRLSAHSDGPGLGSTFVAELPVSLETAPGDAAECGVLA